MNKLIVFVTLIAVAFLTGCVALTESIVVSTKLSSGEIEDGVVYSLPKQLVRVVYTRTPKTKTAEESEQLRITPEPPIPDASHTYYAKIQHKGIYSDTLELKTKNGLLDGAIGHSEDKTGEIIESFSLSGFSPSPSEEKALSNFTVFGTDKDEVEKCKKKEAISISLVIDPGEPNDLEVFIELNESIQSEIIAYLSRDSIVKLLKNLESDDAIAILENVDEKDKNDILSSLPPKDRFALLESLSYPEDTAARIMQREFTVIPSNWSVGQTIDYLRENKDLPEEFLEIFIVDEDFKPIGTVPSSKVLTTSRDTKMLLIMSESQLLIPVDMDKEEVGNVFENYNLNSAAVVDKNNKLVGMITYDDVLTVLKEEAEEDATKT